LKLLFEQYIPVSVIAEDFTSFDINEEVNCCIDYMLTNNFDVIGVKENGHIIGYARLTLGRQGY